MDLKSIPDNKIFTLPMNQIEKSRNTNPFTSRWNLETDRYLCTGLYALMIVQFDKEKFVSERTFFVKVHLFANFSGHF